MNQSNHDHLKRYLLLVFIIQCAIKIYPQDLKLHAKGYFEKPGLIVTVFNDRYPEGHQGGITIIQNGSRVATNGDLRLEPAPGQWQPIPKMGKTLVNRDKNEVSIRCSYPDSNLHARGFNPIFYPDLYFTYQVRVTAEGNNVRILVDLDRPLPDGWDQKVGFNLELFPAPLFGKSWYMDGESGIFPTQANGPMQKDADGNWQAFPMAEGRKLTIAPDNPEQLILIESKCEKLQLLDGRFYHNNGWFVVRSPVSAGKTKGAVEWIVDAKAIDGYKSKPVVQINQVGYHPNQEKIAVIELDKTETQPGMVTMVRFSDNGNEEIVKTGKPVPWGNYLYSHYCQFDFSEITVKGIYQVRYGEVKSDPFRIEANILDRHVWQPTLEYWFPVQMCHMRVNEGYRVWHGLCHQDDALMAPVNHNHFDGYLQGPSTLTGYKPMDHVPGLNRGGWHDAGDYDLRVESQAGAVWVLALTYEMFKNDWDQTTIDQLKKIVEIHVPDGRPDILQQVEHGLLTILGGYENLGRLYRGIICPTLRQYVLLGDGSTMTDNLVFNPSLLPEMTADGISGKKDDRWVFTEEQPERDLAVAEALAVAARVMKGFNDTLSSQSIETAEILYSGLAMHVLEELSKSEVPVIDGLYGRYIDAGYYGRILTAKIRSAVELYIATGKEQYKNDLIQLTDDKALENSEVIAHVGKILKQLENKKLTARVTEAAKKYKVEADQMEQESPYGVPYPRISNAWGLQTYSMKQYHLHKAFPDIYDGTEVLNVLNFVLGCHPGPNTSSFVSGVGSRSATIAYGVNRADGSFVPGGTIKGTLIIEPDLPELLTWPFLWQETEYVLDAQYCGGAAHFMFLVMAASEIINSK